ncbi:MAG: cytidine deaminase [Sphingomonadaceae bacterium]|nr:cytidine deaminase [Sphingomonadaceae bacterium]
MNPTDLIAAARDAAKNAYAPYSEFKVGAAILLTDGRVVTGANVENASYGLSLCAETVALAKVAVEGGMNSVAEIAVIGFPSKTPVRPCGRCRQILNEAAQIGRRDIVIHCSSGNGDMIEQHLLSDMLPHAFGPADLGIVA